MGARGENILEVNGREIRILFTNRALGSVEQRLNKAILSVARELVAGEGSMSDVAHLLRAGMEAANRDNGRRNQTVSLHDAYRLMDEVGFQTVMKAVIEAMTAVLIYTRDDDNETDPNF